MATNFPTSLDSFVNPLGTDPRTNPDHAGQHANINDAVLALETKTGINSSGVATSLDYKIASLTSTKVAKAGDTMTGNLILSTSSVSNKPLQVQVTGDTNPRAYIDGYGSLYFGGLGSSAAIFQLRKDPFTSTFMNMTNTVGPTSILVLDSDIANSGGPNAESTFTGRVIVASGGAEWVDWYHNHYSTNGDLNYGILMQKISPGSYRNFTQAFTDNAVSDPAAQIKNSEWFSVITPTIPTGSSGGTGLTGTGATSIGSAIVTGTGTAFLTELQINDSIAIGSEYRTVLSIADNTHFTVSAVYTTANSGATINKFYKFTGRLGIRTRYPTAYLHIGGGQAGGATVGSAQFKIDAQALLTTPEAGAMEQETNNLYFTLSSTRYSLVMNNKGVSGGQTLVGGTGSAQGLLLSSTSHATKGKIFFGSANGGAFDEATSSLGVGAVIAPTAWLHLGAGTATANQAPLKFTTGTNLGTPEVGTMEYNNKFSLTESDGTRRFVVQAAASTKTTAGAPYTNDGYVTLVINGTSVKVMTTA